MTKEEIKKIIYEKDNNIDEIRLEYFTNYFWVLINNNNLSANIDLNNLIDNALNYAKKIEFYDETSPVYQNLGPDCKGLRDEKTKTIYIRKNLPNPLLEITVYHELHHAIQTNPETNEVGINQESNFGRLIMEAQTQYFSEEIYQKVCNIEFEEREIPSENLRMLPGGTIVSSLHNYEMYDSILTKLSILLNVSKDFFVAINYQYQNNKGMNILKEKYEVCKEMYKLPFEFEEFMFNLDYIYCTDLLAYKDNPDKETILSGGQTTSNYVIHPNKGSKISLQQQFNVLDYIDRECFLCLLDNDENYQEFSKYLFKNDTRELADQMIELTDKKPRQ